MSRRHQKDKGYESKQPYRLNGAGLDKIILLAVRRYIEYQRLKDTEEERAKKLLESVHFLAKILDTIIIGADEPFFEQIKDVAAQEKARHPVSNKS